MAADALNRLNPVPERPGNPTSGAYYGDLPERIERRYFTTTKFGAPFAFYTDARSNTPAFRDHGGRLSTDRNDPAIIRDLVAIAKHRDWTIIAVRGQTEFRREVWITARTAGLEVRGYRPTERDLQDLARRAERTRGPKPEKRDKPNPAPQHAASPGPSTRLKILEAVVRGRIVEPTVQARILATARGRIADWLEQGARFNAPGPPRRPVRDR
jgi:hypothetical protein